MSCSSSSKQTVGTNSAPADGTSGKSLTQAKYDELCCEEPPKTCASYSVAWLLSQAVGSGCLESGATKFFDTKKMSTTVASPQGKDEIKAACCTPFADATCSDWNSMSCSSSSKFTASTNSAPADGSSGKTLTQAKYDELCCVDAVSCNEYTDSDTDGAERQATASVLGSLLAAMAIAVA